MSRAAIWILAGVLAIWNLGLLAVLSRWRMDCRAPGSSSDGASQIAEVNVFNPSNYSERGRRLLPVAVVSQLLLVGTILWAVFA